MAQLKRLRQIIVGARGEALQHVFGMAARGQHQRRHELAGQPHFEITVNPSLSGQHHIQHHHVEARLG